MATAQPKTVPRRASNQEKPAVRESLSSIASTQSQVEFATPDQTIILFDWDDTLCPSHWIRANRPTLSFFKPPPNEDQYALPLKELEKRGEALLNQALKLGRVVIVTNAVEPWVHTSCKNFLPKLLPIVEKIPVIYARSVFDKVNVDSATPKDKGQAMPGMYSANGVNKLTGINDLLASQQQEELSPQHWKEIAFAQEIEGFYSRYSHQSWKNVISIGDSIFERDALHRVVLQHSQQPGKKCRTKTVKLLDDPTIQELIAQVGIVQSVMDVLVSQDGNLNIEIDEEDLQLDSLPQWAGC